MKSQLKKLKGCTIKTSIGQLTLQNYYRPCTHSLYIEQTQYDQIYFKTTNIDGVSKMYELIQDASIQRFRNEMQVYCGSGYDMIYQRVHCEQVKIKKVNYGLVLYHKLDTYQPLDECLHTLSDQDKNKLVISLLQFLQNLKQDKKIFCSIRPNNIYKVGDRFAIINCQFLRSEGYRNDMDSFMLESIQKNWQYWPSQLNDTYTNQPFDYTLDIYAAGCVLYYCVAGCYPFDSKLSASNNQFVRINGGSSRIAGMIKNVAEMFIAGKRRTFNLRDLIDKFKQNEGETEERGYKEENLSISVSTSLYVNVKKSNGGILDNISSVFSKMMNDSQGWFLNYVEDDEKAPHEKYLDNILTKMYKKEQKADKLSAIIQKFISNNSSKINSAKKCLLLIGQAIRKGPQAALISLVSNINSIKSKFGQNSDIDSFATLLLKKTELNEKYKKILAGNFYLSEVSNFRNISIQDLACLVGYLQYLISYVGNKKNGDGSQISQCIVNFTCDEIYDVISMIIISVISIRKDNQLQLRSDNLLELQPIQKILNVSLRKLSDLSSFISAHAIYSLEGEYISYQEQIMMKITPYYSTLQYFYDNSRSYKGLTIPTDYSQVFCNSQKEDKKSTHSANKDTKMAQNGKDYFKEQINSDDEADFQKFKIQTQAYNKSSHSFYQKEDKKVVNVKIQVLKTNDTNHSLIDFGESLNKNNSQNNFRPVKNQSTISFEEFGNIHKTKKHVSPSRDFNDFFNFNESKKQTYKKPPLPNLVLNKQVKSQVSDSKSPVPQQTKKKFTEFEQLFYQGKQETIKKVAFNEPSNPAQKGVAPGFEFFNAIGVPSTSFPHPIFPPPPNFFIQLETQNPQVTKILQGLKLKALKDLILKNKNIIISFGNLKIERVIGSGSAGQVFYGKYKNQQVAIKKVKAKQNPNALKQFERELVTYIKIETNPYLVSLVGLSQSNGDYYLITQFCQCGSLFDLLHKKKLQVILTWKQRLNFALEIAQGMQFLHLMKPIIIHRDLKSLNVFVTRKDNNYKMKVADFGLSRSPEADMMTTQLGTIHWMAPELLEGKQYSFKADVYSYGILLWQILSRTTPYSNLHNPMAILKYVVMDKQRPNMDFIPKQCPSQLINVMIKCWAHEPNDRPPFSQVIRLLKSITL